MLMISRSPSSESRELTTISNNNTPPFSTAGLFFKVRLVPIKADLGYEYLRSDYQAVVRTDTHQILGVHGADYKLVTNEEVFDAFDRALHRSVLNLDGMTVRDELSHQGARSIRTYIFPAHGVKIARVGDVVDLRLQVINSYDGSCAFSTLLGGYRLICTNGMVIGKTFSQSYARHTQGFNLSFILERLNQTIDVYCENTDQWQHWSRITVTNGEVENVLKIFPQSNETLNERLLALYHEERQSLGPTLWALFNALTHFSTHEKVKSTAQANRPAITLQRENKVRTVLNSPEWRRLAAA